MLPGGGYPRRDGRAFFILSDNCFNRVVQKTPDLESFQTSLGYVFRDSSLLRRALTHSSVRASHPELGDNERLEFLGDRVLGLAAAELLSDSFSDASEGELARRLNTLVRMETCAEVAQELQIGACLILGEGEDESGGRGKQTILANACEAVLGAVFLDGGYGEARSLVRRHWTSHLSDEADVVVDAKSTLQEWAQRKHMALPRYQEVHRQGPDHAPSFTTEVHIEGVPPATGTGNSKRAAEQAAARSFLEREGVWEYSNDG